MTTATARPCLIPNCTRTPRADYAQCESHTEAALRDAFGGPVLRRVASVDRLSSRIAAMHPAGRRGGA